MFTPRPSAGGRLRQRALVALVGVGLALCAAWLALVIVSRIDELFFPGQGLSLGPVSLPGVQEEDQGGPTERINVLVMGLDRRPNEKNLPTRTDSMFVLTVDPQTKTAGILGIPRDLWVEIPYKSRAGFFQDRINTAYVTGESQDYSGGGVGLVKQAVEHNLGVEIDHHVIIDFDGFVDLIDELDGIDVYVPEPVNDPYYSHTEDRGDYFPVVYDVGWAHMDGKQALGYSRTRYNSSDLDRIQRQQRVIFAAMDKALQLEWRNVSKIVSLFDDYKGTIDTDLNDLQLPGFAALAVQIEPEKITALSIGAATVNASINGASVLLADKDIVDQIVRSLFSDQQLADEEALVEIQNGTGVDGIASRAVDFLAGLGFPSASLVAASVSDNRVRPQTVIVDFSGKQYTVERLASLLNVPPDRIRVATAADSGLRSEQSDVVVILGTDAQDQRFATDGAAGG